MKSEPRALTIFDPNTHRVLKRIDIRGYSRKEAAILLRQARERLARYKKESKRPRRIVAIVERL